METSFCTHFDIASFLRQGALLTTASGQAWIGWGEASWSTRERTGQLSVYAPDFFLKAKCPWLSFEHRMSIDRDALQAALKRFSVAEASDAAGAIIWSEPSAAEFLAAFQDLKLQFSRGKLRKAVPVVFEQAHARMDSNRKCRLLSALLANSRGVPVSPYGFWTESEGILGASPESLFELNPRERVLRTMALAGTRPVGDNGRLPLLEDPKELHEHRIVVEGITEAIRDAGWGASRIGETRELRLPTFSHLQTPLEVELRQSVGLEDVARVLHPTPALGASPRAPGLEWLTERHAMSAVDRRRFGAPFGAVTGEGAAQCWVAIRNLQWEGDLLSLGAGCGIVPESQADREWGELKLKIQSVKRFFDL